MAGYIQISREYNVPLDVAIAIGKKSDFVSFKEAIYTAVLTDDIRMNLDATDNESKKQGILAVIGIQLYNSLEIDSLSEINLNVIAEYILGAV